jgi:prevent-host-death family protein
MAYPLSAAQEQLGELVAEARDTHRAVTISEHGKAVAVLISVDDLAELQDRAALAEHLADKAAGGVGSALTSWTRPSTGSARRPGREPDRHLPRDGPA